MEKVVPAAVDLFVNVLTVESRSRRLSSFVSSGLQSFYLSLGGRLLLLVALVCCVHGGTCGAEDAEESSVAPESPVAVGIGGHYRVGYRTAVRVVDQAALPSEGDSCTVETLDGDGGKVEYRVPALGIDDFAYVVPGSEAAPLVVRDAEGTEKIKTRFPIQQSPELGPAMLPISMPWIVVIGDPLGVETIGANEILQRQASVAVSKPTAKDFPDRSWGYDGVNLVIITGQGSELLQQLSGEQTQAIVDWVRGGGRLFLTLGKTGVDLLNSSPWLAQLLPISESDLSTREMNPSAIENYTASQNPLEPFTGVMLPRGQGNILVTGRTTRRVTTPMAVEYIVGFGHVTVVAADLDEGQLVSWSERLDLVKRLNASVLNVADSDELAISRSTAFDDLSGQMRASLDQFELKRKFPFSVVALILMALVAAVGPLDYLLVNRLLGRPLLGWLSFPLMAIGLSAILITQSTPSLDPDQSTDASLLRCNQFEVFDVDAIAGVGRGFVWSYLYSHSAAQLDLKAEPSLTLQAMSSEIDSIRTLPFGYAGRTFGGIQISGEDPRFPAYEVGLQDGQMDRSSVIGLALAPRSSKSMATHASFRPRLSTDVMLSRRAGSELLFGELTNPLTVDLLDGMLIYRNLVYLLPTRFPAGSVISEVGDLRQKPFRWQLARRTVLEKSRTDSEDWVASRFDRPDRVAEILMFHEAVGGSRYTKLRNIALSSLDRTDVLADDRCILMGRLANSSVDLNITATDAQDADTADIPGNKSSYMRVVLPVQSVRRQ